MKDGIVAEDSVFDHGSQRGSHNDSGEHGLVEAADQFLKREGDGGNGRIEGRGDAGGHAH